MAKTKTAFFCQNCGAESAKWLGKCPSCNEWNTMVEEVVSKEAVKSSANSMSTSSQPQKVSEIEASAEQRINTNINELNRILGGGLVAGSVVLIGGEPGIGKSTLALQMALKSDNLKILYISGEESVQQIKLRADRLNIKNDNCYLLAETQLESILVHFENMKPQLVIIDSIQTMYSEYIESSPGSVSQIKECTARILKYAKSSATPIILIGHITKDGSLAGPKVLEHIVDAVLQFEGDQHFMYRILRSIKNRYGSTSEIGIFEMQDTGLKEILNPSEILITHNNEKLSGIAVSATINGLRPFLIETQALVSSAVYGTPQRSAIGFDFRRLNMLLAVLEKRAGFRLATKDVFLNLAGGIKVDDPAIDMAIIAGVLSSNFDVPVNNKICLSGEVGLSGEIRPVTRIDQRISEADKLGFEQIIISGYNKKGISLSKYKIQVVFVNKIEELCKQLFGS